MAKFPCRVEHDAREILRDKNLKATPQRLAVLHVLHESSRYMDINTIHGRVRDILPRTGLATIYRTLEMFADIGLVVRIHFEDGCHSYAVSNGGHEHFMVCTNCSRILDFEDCPLESFVESITETTGFRVNRHFVQLFGECAECKV